LCSFRSDGKSREETLRVGCNVKVVTREKDSNGKVEINPNVKDKTCLPFPYALAAMIIGYWWIVEVGITQMDEAARRKKRIVGIVGLVLVILLLILYEPPFRFLNLIEFLIGGLLVGLVANFIFRRIDRQATQIKKI